MMTRNREGVRQETRPSLSAGRRIRRPALIRAIIVDAIIMAGKLGAARAFVNGGEAFGPRVLRCRAQGAGAAAGGSSSNIR